MIRHLSLLAAAGALTLALASPSRADVVMNFMPQDSFAGTPLAGYLTADFHTVKPNEVDLTLSSHLASGEFVLPNDGFFFNLDPTLNPTGLSFALVSDVGMATPLAVHLGANKYRPANGGEMDIELTGKPGSHLFLGGESQTYRISGDDIVDASFDFLSVCGHSKCDPQLAAVHITGGRESDWDGAEIGYVPEPASLAILGVGLLGLGLIRRRIV